MHDEVFPLRLIRIGKNGEPVPSPAEEPELPALEDEEPGSFEDRGFCPPEDFTFERLKEIEALAAIDLSLPGGPAPREWEHSWYCDLSEDLDAEEVAPSPAAPRWEIRAIKGFCDAATFKKRCDTLRAVFRRELLQRLRKIDPAALADVEDRLPPAESWVVHCAYIPLEVAERVRDSATGKWRETGKKVSAWPLFCHRIKYSVRSWIGDLITSVHRNASGQWIFADDHGERPLNLAGSLRMARLQSERPADADRRAARHRWCGPLTPAHASGLLRWLGVDLEKEEPKKSELSGVEHFFKVTARTRSCMVVRKIKMAPDAETGETKPTGELSAQRRVITWAALALQAAEGQSIFLNIGIRSMTHWKMQWHVEGRQRAGGQLLTEKTRALPPTGPPLGVLPLFAPAIRQEIETRASEVRAPDAFGQRIEAEFAAAFAQA